jgi:hypothetical protein
MQWPSRVWGSVLSFLSVSATPHSTSSCAGHPRISATQHLLLGSLFTLALGIPLVQAGTGSNCVGATCSGPLVVPGVQGCVGMGCQPCDDKLLKELRAKREQKVRTYREIVAAAEETKQREGEALGEAKQVFGDYTKDIAKKGATTVAKKTYPVPAEVYAKYRKYKAMTGEVSSTEDVLKLAKFYLEELAKNSGYKDAVERAKWVDTAISGIAMDAKMLTKLKEADFHSEQAFKQWLLGYEALTEARHLEDRIRKLEAQCKQKHAQPQAPPEEQEEKTSGEREQEAAQRMVESWRDVNGEIRNSAGTATSELDAFNEALAIVQGQSSQWMPPQATLASFEAGSSDILAAQVVAANAYEAEWQQFRIPLRLAFEHLVQSVEAFVRATTAFDRLGQDTGTPQSSQPQGSTNCIGMGCGTPPPGKGQQP